MKIKNQIKILIGSGALFLLASCGGGSSSGANVLPNIKANGFSNPKIVVGSTSEATVVLTNPTEYKGDVAISVASSDSSEVSVTPSTFNLSSGSPVEHIIATANATTHGAPVNVTVTASINGKPTLIAKLPITAFGFDVSWQDKGLLPSGASGLYGLNFGFYTKLLSGVDAFDGSNWQTVINSPESYVGSNSYFSLGFLNVSDASNQVSLYSEGNVIDYSTSESQVVIHAGLHPVGKDPLSFAPSTILNSVVVAESNRSQFVIYAAESSVVSHVKQIKFTNESNLASATWSDPCADGDFFGTVTSMVGGVQSNESSIATLPLFAAVKGNSIFATPTELYACIFFQNKESPVVVNIWNKLKSLPLSNNDQINGMGLAVLYPESSQISLVYAVTQNHAIYRFSNNSSGGTWQPMFTESSINGSPISFMTLSNEHYDFNDYNNVLTVPFTIFAATEDGKIWYFSLADKAWKQIANQISTTGQVTSIAATAFGVAVTTSDNHFWLLDITQN